MARVRKRKELMRAEVDKNDIVHRWLRDHVKPERWDKIAGAFPHGGKYSPQQQWVLMQEDAKSPFRYQQYGITVKLNQDKDDRLHSTFLSLPKTYPTLWILFKKIVSPNFFSYASSKPVQVRSKTPVRGCQKTPVPGGL